MRRRGAKPKSSAAEKPLRESERRFRAVFDQQFQFMAVLSPDGRVLEVNDLALRSINASREQVVGQLFWETPWWRDLPQMRAAWPERLANAATAEGAVLSEDEFQTADGTVRVAEAAVTAVKTEDRRVEFFIIQASDITERKRTEAALRQSEQRYRTLFDSIDQGFCVVEMIYDTSGKAVDYRFVEVNACFEEQTGLANATGKTIREMAPAHEEHWFEIYGRVARTGEAIRFQQPAQALSRWYDVYAFPIAAEGSARIGILFKDISEQKKAEEELRRFAFVLNHSGWAVAMISWPGNRIEFCNEAFAKMHGYAPAELMGRTFTETFAPEWLVNWPAHLQQVERGGDYIYESVHIRKDGSRFPVRTHATAFKDENGQLLFRASVFEDITKRHEVEARIATSVQRLELLAAAARTLLETENPVELLDRVYDGLATAFGLDFYFHFAVEGEGRCLRLRAWRGITAAVAQRIETLEFGEAVCGTVARDVKPLAIANVQQSVDPMTEFIREQGITAYACEPLVANGRLLGTLSFGTKGYLAFTPELIGTIRALASMVGVAIARKQSEDALRESDALKSGILNSGLDAIVTINHESKIVEFNPAAERIFGYARGAALGKGMTELIVPPSLRDAHARGMARYLATGETRILGQRIEITAMRSDGSEFPCELAISRVPLDGPPMFTAFVRDITERKRTQEVLARAKEELEHHARTLEATVAERTADLRATIAELESFSYSMSHDLRAPLRAIVSFSQLLKTECAAGAGEPASGYVERITRAAERMDRLIQDVLTYSRLVRQDVTMERIDLEALLKQIIAENPTFQPPTAHIEIATPLARVMGHEASLTQCIYNLIGNGIKFVPPGVTPRVRIRSEALDGKARVWFEDNGIGIAKESQQAIFGMFQRLHREEQYPGTGIGLAIVRKAVERMGGRVGVESEPGQGSRFWIELNRAP